MKSRVPKVSLAEHSSIGHIAYHSAHMRRALHCHTRPERAALIRTTKVFGSPCPGLYSPSLLRTARRFILSDVVSIRWDV
jgi:hypothetical protein